MGEIIINHKNGGTSRIQSKGSYSQITRAELSKQLLGEDILTITTKSAEPIAFEIGDYIDIFGSIYTINQLPTIERTGTRAFEQTIVLEGTQYELLDVQFILPGDTMYDNLTGDLNDFIDVLLYNANRIYPGKWTKGAVPEGTEVKTLSFSEKNCLSTLQTLCEEYNAEFEIIISEQGTRTLHLKQVGLEYPFTFTYGRTGGLYQLTRKNINNKNLVTRLYVYGGRNNLGNKYRNSRLCLPDKTKNNSYIEDAAAVDMYGVKENTKIFDKIYPARYGEVTELGEENFAFIDSTMDFDLNETEIDTGAPEPEEGGASPTKTKWLIPGVTAKLRFTTGNLAGYEFDIHSYDNETKEIQIVPFVDESGYKFPSDTSSAFQIGVGDAYHFIDINLPTAYITTAETKLQEEGAEFYNQYKQPQVQYALSIEPYFLEKYTGAPETVANIFSLGDQIKVRDEDIGVDKSLRIIAYRRDALNPYKYTLTLSDATYSKTIINRIITGLEDINDVIERNKLTDPFRTRRLWMAAQELLDKIFDPEGYYYSEKIKPLSIESTMLQVGAKSQQFMLENTRFEPNYLGNPNTIRIIGGQLTHFTLNDTITIWNLTGGLVSLLDPTKSYFVYAKCEVNGSDGVIIIDSEQHKVDQDPTFYHFIIGHLSSVITNPDGSNGARTLSLTYGSSTINGRFIKTGRIESSGGSGTYFDLDEGVIGGKIRFTSNGAEEDLSDWADQVYEDFDDVLAEIDAAVVKATYWSIKASSPVIYKDAINAATSGTHTPITISGELRSGTTTTQGGFITVTPNGGTEGTATASPVTIAPANGDGRTSYTVKLYDTASKTKLLDTQTIPVVFKGASGVNAINASLSNEADVLPASPEGVISDYSGSGTEIRVYEGATELSYGTGNGQYQVSAAGTGIKAGTPSTSGNKRVYGIVSNMTSDNATITFTITGKTASGASFSLTKVQAFAKSRTGQKGADGVSISLVDVEFAKNTNPTTAPTTDWITTAPTLAEGEQLWTRTKTAYSSGNPTYSTPANITPKSGATGQGVVSITEEFHISSSKTTQPAEGSANWSTTQPTWSQGQYIWSRVKVVYKNPTSTVYTGYAVSSEWEAINNIKIGGRNYFSVNDFVADNKARGYSTIEVIHHEGNIAYRSTNINSNHYVPRYLQGKFEANTQYYLQFKINWESYTDSGAQYIFRIRYTDGTTSDFYASTSHTSRSMLTASGKTIDYITTTRQHDGTVVIYEVQIEKSNKASDWKPAPEDVEANIAAAKTEAENAAKAYADTKAEAERVIAEAYADDIVTAEEQARIDDVNDKLAAAKAYAEAQDASLKTQQEAYADGKISDSEQATIQAAKDYANLKKTEAEAYADGIVSDEEERAIADALAKYNASKAHAETLVDNLEIGGRNLLIGSTDAWQTVNAYDYTPYIDIPFSETKLEAGQTYVFSWETELLSGSPTTVTQVTLGAGVTSYLRDIIWTGRRIIGKQYRVFTPTEHHLALGDSFMMRWYTNNEVFSFRYRKLKLEKGNKPTADWRPAIEDVQANIDAAKLTAEQAQLQAEGFMRARYVRDWLKGNTDHNNNNWSEIKVVNKAGVNLALGLPANNISSNGTWHASYPKTNVIDGNTATQGYIGQTSPTENYVELDLGQVYYDIDYIGVWHAGWPTRLYYGTKTEISEDGINWTTIFDSAVEGTYTETAEGKIHTQRYASVMNRIAETEAKTRFQTLIDGGLIYTALMKLFDTMSGDETAFISGKQGAGRNLPAFGAGGSYQDAVAGTAKAIIRHDGSAKFTDADITGTVNATGGTIGGMHIAGDAIVSENEMLVIDGKNNTIYLLDDSGSIKTVIRPDNIPTSVSSYFSGTLNQNVIFTGIKGSVHGTTTKDSNRISLSGSSYEVTIPSMTLTASTTYASGVGSSILTLKLVLSNGGSTNDILIAQVMAISTGAAAYEQVEVPETKKMITKSGIWRLRLISTAETIGGGTGTNNGSLTSPSTTFNVSEIVNRSEIGSNGVMIATSINNYNFMVGGTFEVRRGNGGIQITNSGIKKWNGTSWVTANI